MRPRPKPPAGSLPSIASTRARARAARLLATAALAIGALGAGEARADDACAPVDGRSTCIDVDNLWARPGGGPFVSLGPSSTTPAGRLSFGLLLSYLSRPMVVRVSSADPNGTTVPLIDNALDATLLWALGVTDRLELTLATPMTLLQDGTTLVQITDPTTPSRLVRSAVRDFRFGASFAILRRPRIGLDEGAALTARAEFGVPVGTTSAFARASTMTAAPSLVFSYRVGRVDVSAEAGARLRGESRFENAVWGSQLSGALGVAVDVIPRRLLTVGAEAFALYTLADQGPTSRERADGAISGRPLVPAEWIASVSSAPLLAGDVSFTLAGGGPIPFGSETGITTPRFRFDLGLRYAPTGRDQDGDGVLDRDDRCPTIPEDRDGFEDSDGCVDPDNDRDRIPDAKDRCRDAAEDFDGFQDDDGCPDLDDDLDGVPDAVDKCRNVPEDRDRFEDEDGCPEADNDGDGIPDEKDRCPNGAEDKDGFKDEDGCPDPDNDLDRIPDAQDRCPNDPEDLDGRADDDGCPDPDDDFDGVLDRADRCPSEPETIDGLADDDGCPEPGARTRARIVGDHVEVDGPARFAAGSDKLSPELETQAKMIAQVIRAELIVGKAGAGRVEGLILEAYADRPGDGSIKALDLAGRRADAVKRALVAAGVLEDRITAAAGDPAAKRGPKAPAFDVTVRRAAGERKR